MFFKKNKKELVFFRHGETDWNRYNLVQGRTDIYLNPNGIIQADNLGRKLAKEDFDFVISSPLRRAKTTGKMVADSLGISRNFQCFDGLIERDFGIVEGRRFDEILKEYADIFAIMDDHSHPECLHVRFPNGESKHEVLTRVIDCACNFMEDNANYNKVAVSCHGGILRYLNLFIHKKVTEFGNCDYVRISLKDLQKYKNKLSQIKSGEK